MKFPKPAKIFLLLFLSFFSCQNANQKFYSDINLRPTNRKGSFASKQTIEGLLYEIWDSGFIRKNDFTQQEILNNAYGVFRKAPKNLSESEGRAYYEKRNGKNDLLMLNAGLFGHLEPAPKQPHMDKVRVKKLDKEIRATLVHELFHDFWHNILDQRKRFLFSIEAEIFFIELMLAKTEHQKQQFLDDLGTGLQAALDFESFEELLEILDIYSHEKISSELYSILASRAYSGESVVPKQFGKYYSVLLTDKVLHSDHFFSSQGSGRKRKNRKAEKPEYLSTIKQTIEENPDFINARDKNGFTLLHQAAYSGNKVITQFLIEKGADTQTKATPFDWTPLFLASLRGHLEVSEALIETGMQLNNKDRRGRSPLHLAAQRGHEELVDLLLQYGACVHLKDAVDITPLHMAALCGQLDTASLLIAKGADTKAKDLAGQTPLHLASFGGNKNLAELLIAEGAEIDEWNNRGETALHLAAFCGNKEVDELLIACGAQSVIRNIHGEIPQEIASKAGHEKIVEILSASH